MSSLGETQGFFDAVYESDSLMVMAVDGEGRITLFNRACEKSSGYSREEVIGRRFWDFYITEDRFERTRGILDDIKEGRSASSLVYSLRTKDGRERLTSWAICPVWGASGEPETVLGIGQDITESSEAMDRLALSEEHFRLLIENALDLVTVLRADNTIGYVGPSVKRLLGYDPREIVGRSLLDFVHPEDLEMSRAALDFAAGRAGVAGPIEVRIRHRDGSWRLHEASSFNLMDNPSIKGLVINSRDVTERRRVEEELARRTNELEYIFRILPDLYFRMGADGTILDSRAGREEDLYVRPEDFLGRRVQDLLPPPVGEKVAEALREVRGSGSPVSVEYALPMPQGEQAYEARIMPGLGDEVVAIVRNITDRVESERWMRAQRDLALELGGVADLDAALGVSLRAFLEASGLDCGGVYAVDPASGGMDLSRHEGLPQAFIETWGHLDAGSRCAALAREGRPVFSSFGKIFAHVEGEAVEPGLKAFAVLPILHDGEAIAVICLASRSMDEVPSQVRGLIEILVGQVSQVVARIRLISALRESEEKYRLLYEQAGEIIFSYGPDLRLLSFNHAAQSFMGYREEEVLGRSILELGILHPEDVPKAARSIQRFRDGEDSITTEYRLFKKNGEMVTVELVGNVLRGPEGEIKAFITIGHDITRRKEEEAFARVERDLAVRLSGVTDTREALDVSLRALLEATGLDGGGIYLVNEATGELEETCRLGSSLPASRVSAVLEAGGAAGSTAALSGPLHLGRADRVSAARVLMEEGIGSLSLVPMLHEDRVIGCVHLVSRELEEIPPRTRDYIEILTSRIGQAVARAMLISALKASEEVYRVTFESTGTAMIIIGLDGTILDGNQEVSKLLGYSREEVLGKRKYTEFIHPEDLHIAKDFSLRLLRGELSGPVEYEARTIRGDGAVIDTLIHVSMLPGMGKSVASIIDVTEKRRYERELETRAEQLRDFLDVAAHELRHPATIIKGYAMTLEQYGEEMSREQMAASLEAMVRSVDQLTRVVDDLLDISRIERGAFSLERGRHEILPLVYRAVEEMMVRGAGNRIEVDLAEDLETAWLDPDKFLRLLIILLDNAVKYSPPDAPIEVRGEAQGDEAVISVLDRGVGVPEEERRRIFERFHQVGKVAHHGSPGMGLGLYIAMSIVEAYGGRIWYEPRPGGGSAFRFTLPL